MRVLLDTHALLWWILDDQALTKAARKTIAETQNQILVSAASAWELAIKIQAGKLPEAGEFLSNFSLEVEAEGFELAVITAEHGIRAGFLPEHHKDPFDRMLIAQAQEQSIPIISNEAIFDHYGVRRIW